MKEDEWTKESADRMAAEWRYLITDMICRAGSGHIGGALSLVDIMHTLYYRCMNTDPSNPALPERDRLVLSKGHAAPFFTWRWHPKGFSPLDCWVR